MILENKHIKALLPVYLGWIWPFLIIMALALFEKDILVPFDEVMGLLLFYSLILGIWGGYMIVAIPGSTNKIVNFVKGVLAGLAIGPICEVVKFLFLSSDLVTVPEGVELLPLSLLGIFFTFTGATMGSLIAIQKEYL